MFAGKKFDVEHALNIIANAYMVLPASEIYNEEIIAPNIELASRCHIYMVGLVPKVKLVTARQEGENLIISFEVLGKKLEIDGPLMKGHSLAFDDDVWFISDGRGNRYGPKPEDMIGRLSRKVGGFGFEVLYIGQSYGKNGSRAALDRLRSHATLQEISLKGIPDGYRLELLLLEINPSRIITIFNPEADDKCSGDQRIANGLDKLFGTNEHERITLFEASLIRYFQPKYNIEFKNSFPSTRMKVLEDCYDKDFSTIVAEISLDSFDYNLWSDVVAEKHDHFAVHELHDDETRRMFFTQ